MTLSLSLQLHLSVSLSSGRDEAKDSEQHGGLIPVHSLNLLLKSIGATLTDVQDVVFKYVQYLYL
jgi:vacuolar protein sorting-associated protein 13A/C